MLKGWLIHMDNALPQSSVRSQRRIGASRVEYLPHPGYSSDLAPSDFIRFGCIKGKPSDYNDQRRKDLLNAIIKFFTGIDQEMLLSVSKSWINRIKCVIKHDGKYYTRYGKTRDNSLRFTEKLGYTNFWTPSYNFK
jgi:hypothetical protein